MQEKRKKVEAGTEKQRTEVLLRTKIIIGISAFILIFTLIVMWWFGTQSNAISINI